ncbi:MAG: copper-translocating P-type ATPase [Chloroflexota bacterium]
MFRNRFWVSLVATIPVLLYSEMIQMWLGFTPPAFPGSQWLVVILSVAIFLYGGLPFLQMAATELRQRQPGMMTLISLAISVAFVYSLATVFVTLGEGFFWELVTLIDVMLLGHWIEMRSVRQASGALDELAKLMPDTAERLRPDGSAETVAVSRLQVGDVVLVRPGSSVPADGQVVEGETDVDEAMITGESRPVKKQPGDWLIGGTVNSGNGSLRAQVVATGEETALAGIMRLVREAQQSRSRTQLLADQAARFLFYTALAVAAVTAVAWTIATGFNVEVLERVVTVLVIACPHALGLAIPLVVAITTSLAAGNGILVRDRLALEAARHLNTVIFDKTGTLTKGEQGVVGLATVADWREEQALALAAAVEGDSEHVIAQAIRRAAGAGATLPKVSSFEALKGRGVKAQVDGRSVYLGGPRLLELLEAGLSETLARFAETAGAKGQTVVYLVEENRPVAALALADVIRPESKEAVRRLHEMGVEVAMLTGDSQAVAKAVAEELGIDRYFAEVLPEHKDRVVAALQTAGDWGQGASGKWQVASDESKIQNPKSKIVAMVGDGVNDAPALTRANVGIAIGSGTDVAVESAGIILVKSNPLDVVKMIQLSRASYGKMIQNLVWATGYNVVALPLAAGLLAPWGILLSPALGALFMSLSTVIVALNAQLLRRVVF